MSTDRDRYRAVLEGAGYQNIDDLSRLTVEQCRMVGEEMQRRTIKVIEDNAVFRILLGDKEKE
jgi:hypothetical protein